MVLVSVEKCSLFVYLLRINSEREIVMSCSGPVDNGGVYCETEAFNASCELGSAILMTHARYGRMRLSRCVRHDYGHVGCASDVIDLVDTRCSARRRCSIRVPDALLATTKPCPDDLKPYLEARYVCVKGTHAFSVEATQQTIDCCSLLYC